MKANTPELGFKAGDVINFEVVSYDSRPTGETLQCLVMGILTWWIEHKPAVRVYLPPGLGVLERGLNDGRWNWWPNLPVLSSKSIRILSSS